MAISIDLAIGSVATSGGGGGGSVNTGVLQVSGGGALSETLQTITDQSSNASPLQLSTTQVRVYNSNPAISALMFVEQDSSTIGGTILHYRKNGSVNMTTGQDIGYISFGGYFNSTYTPNSQVVSRITAYYGGSGTDRVGGLRFITWGPGTGATSRIDINPNGNIAMGAIAIASSRLHVVGDGTNPIARFENLANSTALLIGSSSVPNRIWSSLASSATLDFYTGGAILTGQWGTGTGYSFSVANGLMQHSSGTSGLLNLSGNFSVASGTGVFRPLSIEYTVSTSGTYSGTTTGIFLNATESVTAGTHNLMDLQRGGVSRFRVTNTGTLSNGYASFGIDQNGSYGAVGSNYYLDSSGTIRRLFGDSGGFIKWSTNGAIDIRGFVNGAANSTITSTSILSISSTGTIAWGTTNAEPAIKRNGTAIEFVLADNVSGFCSIFASSVRSSLMQSFSGANNGRVSLQTWNNMIVNVEDDGVCIQSGAFASPNASAILQANSTTKGFLPPRMTTTEINAIVTPAEGLVVYNTTIGHLCVRAAGVWHKLSQSSM
jgi:hypothetical protein